VGRVVPDMQVEIEIEIESKTELNQGNSNRGEDHSGKQRKLSFKIPIDQAGGVEGQTTAEHHAVMRVAAGSQIP